MKKNKITLLLCMLSLIATAAIYHRLPDIVPMHWNIKGEVDRYDPKYMLLILSALPLVLTLFYTVLPKIDPRRDNYKKHGPAYQKLIFFITLFLIVVNWTVIGVSLGMDLDINTLVPIGIGILFIIIGNYMPQFRHNYFVGIKTPWALSDEENWRKTHFLGGYVFMLDGLLFIILGFLKGPVAVTGILVITLTSTLCLYLYSYMLYAKKHKND